VEDSDWQIVAAADFNGDGHPDLVWRHAMSGQNVVWYLSGTTLLSQAPLPSVSDPTWTMLRDRR
jgi:FG-GAP repeat